MRNIISMFNILDKTLKYFMHDSYNTAMFWSQNLLDSTKLRTKFVYSICIVIMSKKGKTSCKERKRIEPRGSQDGYVEISVFTCKFADASAVLCYCSTFLDDKFFLVWLTCICHTLCIELQLAWCSLSCQSIGGEGFLGGVI